jgi:uncharacterized protein YdhG (YjbR/CyaY superfamily)
VRGEVKAEGTVPKDVDEYIAGFPQQVQERMQEIRATIRETAPGAEESISYKMPTYKIKGERLIYFAAYKNHIALYPAPAGVKGFEADMALYGRARSTLGFPNDKPLPYELIRRVVRWRMETVSAEGA